jgi:thymidine phosphorylase
VGGLPGNRTTPIVVSIVAAFGLTYQNVIKGHHIPAGTADCLETMTKIDQHQTNSKVVEQENGCFVGWFNKTKPRDDIIIRVERALDVDGEGQMIASVLSKKDCCRFHTCSY